MEFVGILNITNLHKPVFYYCLLLIRTTTLTVKFLAVLLFQLRRVGYMYSISGICFDRLLAEEIVKLKKQLYNLYVRHTGMEYEEIERMMDRDKFLSPQEAVSLGIIDHVEGLPPTDSNNETNK